MSTTVYIVQHAEKVRRPGDPPLSAHGIEQAKAVAAEFAALGIGKVVSSDLRRARETARVIATELGLNQVHIDPRFRERMNLEINDDIIEFAMAWERCTYDRDHISTFGDSSRQSSVRFKTGLDTLIAADGHASVLVVTHGGCTVDFLRDVVSDAEIQRTVPGVILNGIRPCAITEIRHDGSAWEIVRLAGVPMGAS